MMEGRQRPFIMEFRVNVIATGTGRSKILEGTYLRHPGVTAPGAAPTLSRMDDVDEAAAWRELKAAIGEALWHYAEAVPGVHRDSSGEPPGGFFFGGRLQLARLSAARRAREVL